MNKLKTYRASSTGDFIFTVALGVDYLERWQSISLPLWLIYCERHRLGLAALVEPYDDPGQKRLDWQKLLAGKALRDSGTQVNNVCFVDYDVVPNPFCPNVFEKYSANTIGFVSQRNSLPYGDVESVLRRIVFHRNKISSGGYPLDSYIFATPSQIFLDHNLPPHKDYGCGGFFVFNHDRHSKIFEDLFYNSSSQIVLAANPGEEVYLNSCIQSSGCVEWLPYSWHVLWWYEMAWSYPWLYRSALRDEQTVREAIYATLLKSSFLHFVGSWEKWAWNMVPLLCDQGAIAELESLSRYCRLPLSAPNLGPIFPNDDSELALISK